MISANTNILLIDNRDSFTYNLVQAFEELGCFVEVLAVSDNCLPVLNKFQRIVFSPGPGLPDDFPVMFEILLGTILLQLGFGNGAIAAMVFTAPSFGLFTLVLTKNKLGGYKVPLIIIGITFIFGIGAGLFAELLTKFF